MIINGDRLIHASSNEWWDLETQRRVSHSSLEDL